MKLFDNKYFIYYYEFIMLIDIYKDKNMFDFCLYRMFGCCEKIRF